MNSVTPDISANPLFGTAIHSIGRACDQERIRAATLTERALVEQIEALGALAEHRRIVNEELAGQLQDLVAVKADAERALAERSVALKALENANRAIDRFTYAASHDLKAPLRGIGHVSDWLEEDLAPVLTEKSKEHLELLRGRVCRMEALIDGIIAYAGASRAKDLFEPIALAPLLDEVVATLAPAPGVVTMEIPDSMPLLWVQSVPFRQMWLNLVGNALKHGARDGAAIRLAVKDAGDAWELSVSDNLRHVPDPEGSRRGRGRGDRARHRANGGRRTGRPRVGHVGTGKGGHVLLHLAKIMSTLRLAPAAPREIA
jgi:signal transduction histidine kinase